MMRSGNACRDSLLPVGGLRSYGDSCLNGDGALVDMRGVDRLLGFDPETGFLEAQAGLPLPAMIAAGAPHGYFPPVVPGTQFVTLGGMIANDVHGKNHHRRGTFGRHVVSLDLLRSDGVTYRCSRDENPNLFAATIGGMGLTGVILSATVRMMRVASLDVAETATPFGSLADYFDLAPAVDDDNEYAVAWSDQLAGGAGAGRGVLLAGNHAPEGARVARPAGGRLGVPVQPPVNVLNRPFLRLFNAAYRISRTSRARRLSGYQGFFFPLDGVRNWNRLYGPRGLFQHQSVVPDATARDAIPAMLDAARRAGHGSFLTVLKRFGALPSPGILSFPRPGYTLTLDFPNAGASTLRLLDDLDTIAVDAGGAVNPYKDARMGPATFAASFPRWRELEARRDAALMSDFWKRTAERLDRSQDHPMAAE